MRTLQGGFAKRFNWRWKRSGQLWQSKFPMRLVDSQTTFERLVISIHLNPDRDGLVEDPAEPVLSGHRELVGEIRDPLLDTDAAH
jgi:hypothetical protein